MIIMEEKRNFGLDMLRSIAILLVVISHARHIFHNDELWRLILCGYYGVELFFVLSGFLIGRILLRTLAKISEGATIRQKLSSLRHFWIRRWFRTLPLYWLRLCFDHLRYCGLGLLDGMQQFYLAFFYLLFLQSYQPFGVMVFPEAWSLSVEEYFYLLIPIALVIMLSIQKSTAKNIIFMILAVLLARILYVAFTGTDNLNWDWDVRRNTFLRLDSLGIGVLLAYIYLYKEKWFHHAHQKMALLLGTAFIAIIACLYFGDKSFVEGFFAKTIMFDLVSIAMGLILCYAYHITTNNHVIHWIFTTISKISYAIYLIHFPIFMAVADYTEEVPSLFSKFLLALAACAIAFVLSYAVHKYYEYPMMCLRERFHKKEAESF